MRTPVLVHSLRRRASGSSVAPAGGGRPGVRILPNQFTDLYLSVEIAWAADLTASPDTWSWTDVTGDVRVADGIAVKVGRGDEASSTQPATCALTVRNADGGYSLGGLSRNWPNVRRNTPLRVRIDPGTGPVVAFLGNIDGFTPAWSTSGADDTVQINASGTLRRLGQGDAPVTSPMRRAILSNTAVVAYWPCEDGENAQNIAAATGPYPMTFYSPEHAGANPDQGAVRPDLGASSAFLCSDPILELNGSELYGHVGGYTRTGTVQVRTLIDFPSAGGTDSTVLVGLQCDGSTNTDISSELWEVRYKTGGGLNVRGWARGALVVDTTPAFGIDGLRGQMCLTLFQNGANIDWRVDFLEEGADFGTYSTGTAAARYFGEVQRVQLNTDGGNSDVAVGHVALLTTDAGVFAFLDELNAHDGDSVTGDEGRLLRLCTTNGVGLTRYRIAASAYQIDDVGPQDRASLVTLLRQAEQVDHGILWDGRDAGLSYTSRVVREAAAAAFTLDASELLAGLVPVDDDQVTVNRFTATRVGGGFWTHEASTGAMGNGAVGIGLYDDSGSYNVQDDESLPHFAGWAVATGTVEGYRYPQLTFDVARIPDRVGALLGLIPGSRVDLSGVAALRPQVPVETARLAVQGWTMTIAPHRWIVTLNASPYDVWAVTVLEGDTGTPGEFAGHLDTDGSTLAAAVDAGATSLSVATTTGPVWTTTATDYPITLDVAGVPVIASACAGASSPQTFTVAAIPRAFPPGVPVKVRAPARLAI